MAKFSNYLIFTHIENLAKYLSKKKKFYHLLQILVENTTFRISSALFSKIFKEIEKIHDKS
jgi:hypothetical protein